jgi:hypothetical protein
MFLHDHNGKTARGHVAKTVFMGAIATLLFAVMPLHALAASAPSRSIAQGEPRIARLQINIWPEYDRRAALVILNGELPAELALPAAVTLRIPASSGGASAVAYASGPRAELFNLAYDQMDGDAFITLRFNAPQRYFHVEFYDPISIGAPDRSYTYVWPGDLPVERLSVRLQEPAAASDISVEPDLGAGVEGPDGLLYRTADFGARDPGRQLPIGIRYTKQDPRTSAEVLGMGALTPAPPASDSVSQDLPGWLVGLASVLAVSIATVGGLLWWRRRERTSGARPQGAGFCRQCGNGLASGDRFCPQCGTGVRKS